MLNLKLTMLYVGGMKMDWDLVRGQYPDKLALTEALATTLKDSIRTMERSIQTLDMKNKWLY